MWEMPAKHAYYAILELVNAFETIPIMISAYWAISKMMNASCVSPKANKAQIA